MRDNRFILSVFPAAGLCAGDFASDSVLAQMHDQLGQWGLTVTSWEPITRSNCSALLIYAENRTAQRLNLLEFRRQLSARLQERQLQIRIQREDLFLAMHRL